MQDNIFFFSTLVLVSFVLNKLYAKITVKNVDPIALTILTNVFALFVFLPFVFKDLISVNLNLQQLGIIILGGLCWTVTGMVSTISVKKSDVSLREPMLALRVIFVSILAFLFLGEVFTIHKLLFTALIFSGVFLAGYRPGKGFDFQTDGTKWVIFSVLTMSISVFVDKLGSTKVGVELYTWCMYFIPFLIHSFKIPKYKNEIKDILQNHRLNFVVLSLTMILTYWSQIKLYSMLPISIAYPIIQFGSILTILAAIIFLGEKENLKMRIAGSLVATVGVLLIKLGF